MTLALRGLIKAVTPLLPEAETSDTFLAGVSEHALGHLSEAEQCYLSVLAREPAHPGALFALGVIRLTQNMIDDGLAMIDEVIAGHIDSPECLFRYGQLLAGYGRSNHALDFLFRGLGITPEDDRIELAIANILRSTDRVMEALYHCGRAIQLNAVSGPAWSLKGALLLEFGRFAEARRAFETAIKVAPSTAWPYMGLAGLGTLNADSDLFAHVQAACESEKDVPPSDRAVMHFALGTALERFGDYRSALASYIKANALRRPEFRYDEVEFMKELNATRTHFSPSALRGNGDPSDLPIFIVGFPRSGSTLLEQVLSSHPAVYGAGEIRDWAYVLKLGEVDDIEKLLAASDDQLRRIGREYVNRLRSYSLRAKKIVNKMLGNFITIGTIRLALKNAVIIHIKRNPIDTCVSCFSKCMPIPFTYDLGELGRNYRAYRDMMAYWSTVLPAGSVLDVSYEDLIDDFETQARRVINHCSLEWDDSCLRFHETKRNVRTASCIQVRQPIYKGTVGRWRKCVDLLQPLIEGLGPELCLESSGAGGPTPNQDMHKSVASVTGT